MVALPFARPAGRLLAKRVLAPPRRRHHRSPDDLGMPFVDGYEVARRLAAAPRRPTLIVAVSGWGDAQARQRTQAAGFDAHLVKPVQWSALASVFAG